MGVAEVSCCIRTVNVLFVALSFALYVVHRRVVMVSFIVVPGPSSAAAQFFSTKRGDEKSA